ASIGAPWIFHDIRAAIDGTDAEPLSVAERFNLIRRQIRESIDRIDEYRGILHIRRHLAASPLFKGISHFRDTRIRMLQASTLDELMDILAQVEQLITDQSLN
ncbi:MAG: tRNA dihydrouridine synthase DusB, partial [Duncaniella sp.]|nr:tRNA dihydrouridine synthase DusB [Duncaniella sp.]